MAGRIASGCPDQRCTVQPRGRCARVRKLVALKLLSCAEAQFHVRQCGMTRLDGDRDGVPCERLCR